MPLDLHAAARQRLIQTLSRGLAAVYVKNGMFLDDMSLFLAGYEAENVLPTNGILRSRLDRFLGEFPLLRFIENELRGELARMGHYVTEPERQLLSSLPGYEDTSALAERFVSSFDALPRSYCMTVSLPATIMPLAVFDGQILSLGANGCIRLLDLLFSEQFPASNPDPKINQRGRTGLLASLMIGAQHDNWSDGSLFFQEKCEGYIGIYGAGVIVDDVASRLESFIGLGLSLRAFNYNYKYDNKDPKLSWVVHECGEDGWDLYTRFDVEEEISDVMRHIISFRFEDQYPIESRIPWIRSAISRINGIFSSDRSSTICLAAKWYFDSYKGRDPTLRYIRLMTTLEILLGEHADTSKASLGEILGNRLAYLIGKSHKERAEILVEFKDIYGVRSSILHHGKHRLKGQERLHINTLRTYCQRAIEAEAKLILAE